MIASDIKGIKYKQSIKSTRKTYTLCLLYQKQKTNKCENYLLTQYINIKRIKSFRFENELSYKLSLNLQFTIIKIYRVFR